MQFLFKTNDSDTFSEIYNSRENQVNTPGKARKIREWPLTLEYWVYLTGSSPILTM